METASQTQFDILGQKIVISQPEEIALAKIAVKIVQQKIDELKTKRSQLGPQQIAVMALLELAGEMVKDRQAIDQYREELDKRCSQLMTKVTQVSRIQTA